MQTKLTKLCWTNETVPVATVTRITLSTATLKTEPSPTSHQGIMCRILNRLLAPLFLIVLCLGLATVAQAQVSTSSCVKGPSEGDSPEKWLDSSDIVMERVDYVERKPTTSTDLRGNEDADHPGTYYVRLRGWLYYAANRTIKDRRVVIYNHGYNQSREEPCSIAKYFVNQGFVVFAPLRRGHFAKTPNPEPVGWKKISSTGVHIAEYVADCHNYPNCPGVPQCGVPDSSYTFDNAYEIDYLRQQVVDVADQLKYILGRSAIGPGATGKLADPKKIALIGHSYGAGLTLFANAQLLDHAVAISISAGELSWGNDQPFWESEPSCAVVDAKRPIYFIQPKNALTLKPTRTFFGLSLENKRRSQAAIFPSAPVDENNSSPATKQAHKNFVSYRSQVSSWGPSVIEFLERHPLP